MSFSIGIVGLPNVGKSTLFTALTKKPVEAANYPFCTIEPNVGVVEVPEERIDKLGQISKSKKIIPTVIEFVDIAGLVKGASSGEGLGNQFLSHIREVDAILEVVRHFDDPNVVHVSGVKNPEDDKVIINTELALADLATVEKRLTKLQTEAKGSKDKKLLQTIDLLAKIQKQLADGLPVRQLELTLEEKKLIRDLNLLTAKPLLYVNNIDEKEIGTIPETGNIINICAKLEADLVGLTDEEVTEYLTSAGLKETGLDKLIKSAYQLLDLITFITTGPEETRAWTVEVGVKAPEAAGRIHSDFEKLFIRAEVYNWQLLVEHGSEVKLKEKGLIQVVGKDYEVKDGDVCYFRTGQA